MTCQSFSIRELFWRINFDKNKQSKSRGFFSIDEIPQESTLLKKKGRLIFDSSREIMENRKTHKTFMQLTAGTQAIVFDLSSEDRTEVAMIHELEAFKDPITFSHTGFVYNTYQRAFDSNLHASLGV